MRRVAIHDTVFLAEMRVKAREWLSCLQRKKRTVRLKIQGKEDGYGCVHKAQRSDVQRMGASSHADACDDEIAGRSRYDRVCNFGRGIGRNCHSRNYSLPASFAGALERYCRRHQWIVERIRSEEGQSTVEFAVVTAGFLSATLALSVMWRVLGGATLVEHAVAVASHHVQGVAAATLVDIFLY